MQIHHRNKHNCKLEDRAEESNLSIYCRDNEERNETKRLRDLTDGGIVTFLKAKERMRKTMLMDDAEGSPLVY